MPSRLGHSPKHFLAYSTVLLLAVFAVWIQNRDRPLINHLASDEAQWIAAAENYDRYGIWTVRLQPVVAPYPATLAESRVYQTGPPGLTLTTYVAWALFGRTPFAARLAPLYFCMVGAAALAALARRLYGREVAILALFFVGFTPLMVYYSGNVNFEQFLLPLLLLGLILYRQWLVTQHGLWVLTLLSFAAIWYSPFWFIALGLLTIHAWWTVGWRRAIRLWPVWLAAVMSIGIIVGLAAWYNPNYLAVLQDGMDRRAVSLGDSSFSAATLLDYLQRYAWLGTPIVVLLAGIGLWNLHRRPRPASDRWYPAIMFGTTLTYNAVFWKASALTYYFPFFAIIALCLWGAFGGWALWIRRSDWLWRSILMFLLATFLFGSWHWSRFLHNIQELPPEVLVWGEQVQESVSDREVVATNLWNNGYLLDYHLRRRVEYQILPAGVLSDTPGDWAAYLYCGMDAPEWITGTAFYTDPTNNCYLVSLK